MFVKKPTGFLTNSFGIARELEQSCNGLHSHVHLVGGRAHRAEVYPDELCYRILKGLVNQMKMDGRIQEGCIGMMCPEEKTAWDDQTGEALDWDGVVKARAEEMDEFRRRKVYRKVPLKECWDKTGKAPIKIRWVDINKGDKVHPEYRSRLVAKDFKNDKNMDLFAATPPLEALKLLMSMWMTEGIGWSKQGGDESISTSLGG